MTDIDNFALLNDLKELLRQLDNGDTEQVRSELKDIIDRVQADCDEKHRIYLERVERYMDHVDSALKDRE
jgi:predicted glycosyltransferase